MLTALGKALRMLRIERNLYLRDMAEEIGVSSAFLSAVETGSKKAPANLVARICEAYQLNNEESKNLEKAAHDSIGEISIRVKNSQERHLVEAFAKRFPSMNSEEQKRLISVLASGETRK